MCWLLLAAVGLCIADALDCSARGSAQGIAAGHNMTGKLALLTGSDTGIGYETALALAGLNAQIIIANHNAKKGQAAVDNITRLTGNTKVEALQLDLSSFDSVRKVAATVLSKHKVLDVVINDAGTGSPYGLTNDGFEYVVEVNYLGHFLLEQLFLPALRASSNGKVIHVSSGASFIPCQFGGPNGTYVTVPNCTDLGKLANITKTPQKYSTYGLTKFMMIYNARELAVREAARGSKVRAYSIRPGLVDTPLERQNPDSWRKKLCSLPNCAAGFRDGRCDTPCPMPQTAGAVSPTYVAVTDLPADQDGDLYWQCKPATAPVWENAETNQRKLYDMSLKWTGTSSMSMMI
jgi:NAD(P)-dependent dehydrogenase (short-subunit alcohol dehydrogenase family)